MAKFSYTDSPLGLIGNVGGYVQSSDKSYSSLFTSKANLRKSQRGVLSGINDTKSIHNDDFYDISPAHVIDKLKKHTALSLKNADFAYLKDYGVYPLNRLVVARRFPTPVIDDLFSLQEPSFKPMSTLIGYIGDSDKFLDFTVSEKWTDSEASFEEIFNGIGKDIMGKMGEKFGGYLAGGANLVPLPGYTQLIQRKILQKMGLINSTDVSELPIGDPNLIKQAKIRDIPSEGKAGSGLKCKFNITLTTVYEQKFINGVDPTIVYMDILNNILSMGTSNANFYLGKQNDNVSNVKNKLEQFMNDPFKVIKEFITSVVESLTNVLKKLGESLSSSKSDDVEADEAKKASDVKENNILIGTIKSVGEDILKFIVLKYKHQFIGVLSALAGAPSTPWHITIGNPLRPIFCSGDMLCTSTKVDLGTQLAFNNLPTRITVTSVFESARDLGQQEIMAKLNSGGVRSINGTYISLGPDTFYNSDKFDTSVYNKESNGVFESPIEKQEIKEKSSTEDIDNQDELLASTSKVGNERTDIVNTDPNSQESTVSDNTSVDTQRQDATQDITGSTDGFSKQTEDVIGPDTSGVNAKVIEPESNNKNNNQSDDQLVKEFEQLENDRKNLDTTSINYQLDLLRIENRQTSIQSILNSPGHSF